ncbi:MAG: septal ring lytic transglycosylase RlpA family protein [Terricaulis sp.]
MKTFTLPRILFVTCIALIWSAGAASAEPAPIQYAANAIGEVYHPQVSPGDGALVGGDARSYGYGAQRQQGGAVIDLRRPTAATAVQHDNPQAAAPAMQSQPVGGQGRPSWLETERVGQPYQANGRWYVPTPEPGYSVNGVASWYGPNFHGQRGANGEVYDQEAMTAAHPTLPLNSLVQVTNLANGREVIVRVTDRGPFVGDRVIDLSHAAAQVLGYDSTGTARVNVRYLGPAPRRVNADGSLAPREAPAQTMPAPETVAYPEQGAPAPAAAQNAEGPVALAPPPVEPQATLQPIADRAELAGAPAAASAGAYFVQVGAFSDVDNAHRVRDAVASAGNVVLDTRRNASGMELFRVRLGPWQSREEAESARQSLASMGYAQSVVAAP